MTFISINSVDMPAPVYGGYSLTVADLDSSNTERSETGILTRERVRAGVYKIACKWLVNTADLQKLVSSTEPAELSVTFFIGNGYKTATMYTGDKQISLRLHKDNEDWWDFSCNFVEM